MTHCPLPPHKGQTPQRPEAPRYTAFLLVLPAHICPPLSGLIIFSLCLCPCNSVNTPRLCSSSHDVSEWSSQRRTGCLVMSAFITWVQKVPGCLFRFHLCPLCHGVFLWVVYSLLSCFGKTWSRKRYHITTAYVHLSFCNNFR